MTGPESVTISTMVVNQPIGTYYVGRASASDLLTICHFDFRRMMYTNGYVDFLGIQRQISQKRAKEICQYAGTVDAVFPTAIVISIPDRCVTITEKCDGKIAELVVAPYRDPDNSELDIPIDQVASIIDGQHRLYGIQLSQHTDIDLPVAIFVGIDDAIEASIFSIVNLAQTKVNKSLVYDLFSLAQSRSPEKTCHEIVVALDRMPNSPFKDRIKRLGTATDGRFGETLAQATMVRGLLPYITSDALADRDRGKRFGFWEPLEGPQQSRRIFYEFFRRGEDGKILANVFNYFSAIRNRWPAAWSSTGKGNMINRTNGYNGFMRFLRPAYRHITTGLDVVSEDSFSRVFANINLEDDDFTTSHFVPGTSGATLLFQELLARSGISA